MFTLGNVRRSHTKDTIATFAALQSTYDDGTAAHLRSLELDMKSDCFVGYSQHDQLFRLAASDDVTLSASENIKKHDAMDAILRSFKAPVGPTPRVHKELQADISVVEAFSEPLSGNTSTPFSAADEAPIVNQTISGSSDIEKHSTWCPSDDFVRVSGSSLCCARHMANAEAVGIHNASLARCECVLTPGSTELLEYAREFLRANEVQHSDVVLTEHLETTLDALAVCDSDIDLHVHAMKIGSALGWLM
jgi:hypothetical protein